MDPQSQSFTPYSNGQEGWKLQTDVTRLQQVQQEHSERLARLERKQEDDARMKSVWGNSSPFPSVLSGTPQQAPLQQPPLEQFRNFDEDPNSLMASLHLDAEEEPRRGMGANSRANSVRFDETANQNHFSHSSRPSMDIFSRTSSGLGGLQMNERTASHKSDGRASSAHSMRSAASGRVSSLNLDMGCGLGDANNRSPQEPLNTAPGLLFLGSVPAIIRCWMNTNFKHDALLYAAVCTGSYKSFIDLRLIQKLGFEDEIKLADDELRTVRLPVYFPEAVLHPASSRSSSPAPHMPNLTVDFRVVNRSSSEGSKSIQIFLGSDTLQAHSADILFSSNTVNLIDDEQSKLSIPLVRPENEEAFRSLCVTSSTSHGAAESDEQIKKQPNINGVGQGSSTASISSAAASPPLGKYRPPGAIAAEADNADSAKASAQGSDNELRPSSQQSNASRPALSLLNTKAEANAQTTEPSSQATPQRTGSSPAIWSNWRREGNTPTAASTPQANTGLDWANAGKNRENSYQRRDTGMKVLKPKAANRTFSTSATTSAPSPSPADGKSRFFDEGRRKSGPDNKSVYAETKKENQLPAGASATSTASGGAAPKTKSNPIGGGSAFSWLTPPGGGSGTGGGALK